MTLVRNDFEPLILHSHGIVGNVKQALYVAGAEFAQMSGSGSSVYGFFRNEVNAQGAETALREYKVFTSPPHFNPE